LQDRDGQDADCEEECEMVSEPAAGLTLKQKLDLTIKKKDHFDNMQKKDYFCKIILLQTAYYEAGKKRGHYLQN
jgi:hypothetical protein